MTIASHLLPRRRVLVLVAASVLLHCVAISWVGQGLGTKGLPAAPLAPRVIVAELRQAPAVVAGEAALDVVTAPATQRARARALQPGVGPAATQATQPLAAAPEAGVAQAEPEVQLAAAREEVKQAEALPEHGYRVNLPPPAELTLDVERTDAGGGKWSGQAVMAWSRSGSAYRMSVVASITMIVTINLVQLASEGTVGEQGIMPRTMTEKRRSKAATATHFEQGRITFSASSASYPIVTGTQDKATFPMQLAGIARADAGQLGSDIELMVGEDKDATVFRFVVQGQEDIDTPMGKIATWRLTRPPRPGSYSSRLDVWLAPAHEWYPVQIRSTEANGAVTTQTIRKIVMHQAGT